jgi:hypothetical protein
VDLSITHVKFGLFEPSPASASVTVAPADLLLFRYKLVGTDTVIVDFRIAKAFFQPTTAVASGITMELSGMPARPTRMTASSRSTLAASRTFQAAWLC